MPTYTSKGLIKPLVDNPIDEDLWGTHLNANSDKLETLLNNTTAEKTADFNVLTTEFNYTYLIDASGAAVTATLPEASTVYNGFVVRFKAIDASNTVTINGYSSETIDGEETKVVSESETLTIVCNGTNWNILSGGSGVPAGAVMSFAFETPPTGWLECDGSAISRTAYATLFSAISTVFGVGNGSTTFNLPDLRGQFIRGWDNGAGIDPDAASRTDSGDGSTTGDNVGTVQGDALQNITASLNLGNGVGADGGTFTAGGAFSRTISSSAFTGFTSVSGNRLKTLTLDASDVARTSTETRPKNISLMYCIKE